MNSDNEFLINPIDLFIQEDKMLTEASVTMQEFRTSNLNLHNEYNNPILSKFEFEQLGQTYFSEFTILETYYEAKEEETEKLIQKADETIEELKHDLATAKILYDTKKETQKHLKEEHLKTLNKKIEEYQAILDKELDLFEKIKSENEDILNDQTQISQDLNDALNLYTEFSHLDVVKTEQGHMKIIFSDLNTNKIDAHVKLEIKNNSYQILETFPKIECKNIQSLLKTNFTTFLAQIALNFIEFFKKNPN